MRIAPGAAGPYNLPSARSNGNADRMTETAPTAAPARSRAHIVARMGLIALALAAASTGFAHDPAQEPERVSIRSSPPLGATLQLPLADHIVVRKGARRMYLMHGDDVLRTYKIALGLHPVGQKERSGDFRTPEGRYFLTRRNPHSEYFLSIQVSYPNDADLQRARHHHWDAGGSIMIHGLPNYLHRPPGYYEKFDWTDGCIAVSDSDMVEIWLMTEERTPIDILP